LAVFAKRIKEVSDSERQHFVTFTYQGLSKLICCRRQRWGICFDFPSS